MFERNAAVLPDTGNVDTELISLLKHLPSDTLASLLAQYNSTPAPTSGSAVLAHVFAADAKDPTSTAQQPLSPIDELRQALASIPFTGDKLVDMQALGDYVSTNLCSQSPALAEGFINTEIKNRFRLTTDDASTLTRTYREAHKAAKKAGEYKTAIPGELPGSWYEVGENGSLRFYPGLLAQHLADTANVIYAAGTYYQYNDGVYREISRLQAQGMVQSCMIPRETHDNQVIDTTGQWQRQIFRDHNNLNPDTYVINLKNGLFDVRAKTLAEHNPKFFSIVRIPASYDTNAKCPLFLKFLGEMLEGNYSQITLVQEIMGYLLIPTQRAQKAFIFIGKGATGKSVLLNTIRDILLGADSVSSVTWQQLSDRFRTAELFGKLANIFSDLPETAVNDTSLFKALTGGDAVTAEKKYSNPFSFMNQARLLFSCNKIPLTSDTSDGFFRRLIIITCNHVVPESERDPYLIDKFRTEADGILQFALEGLYRLMANDFKFSISDKNLDALDDYRRICNPVLAFAQDMLVTDAGKEIGSTELYEEFKRYCNDDKNIVTQKKFSTEIQAIYQSVICTRDTSGKKRVFRGITYRSMP